MMNKSSAVAKMAAHESNIYGEKMVSFLEKSRERRMIWCEAYFDVLNHLGVTHKCHRQTDRQIDGRTDILVANAALNYVAWPKR